MSTAQLFDANGLPLNEAPKTGSSLPAGYDTGMAWAQEAEEGMSINPARRALASVLRREEVPGAPEPTPVEPLKTKRQVRF